MDSVIEEIERKHPCLDIILSKKKLPCPFASCTKPDCYFDYCELDIHTKVIKNKDQPYLLL